MADAVTSQTLVDGERNLVVKLTNLSDGTGESAVTKVDVSALTASATNGACTEVRIDKIQYDINGMEVQLLWDGSPDLIIGKFTGQDEQCYKKFGGLTNNASTPTGDVLLTTTNHTAGDSYTIILHMVKKYG